MQIPKPAVAQICRDIYQLMLTVTRGCLAGTASEVCEILRQFEDSKKRSLWVWLSQHDFHLKQWLTNQGTQHRAVW